MKYLRIIVLVLIFPLISFAGIQPKMIAEGIGAGFHWSVLDVGDADEDLNLIVIIQNTGAKWIDTTGIDAKLFTLTNASGKEVKIHSATGFKGIGLGSVTVGHVLVEGPISPLDKFQLELKVIKDSFVPVSFVAKGVQFRKSGKQPIEAEH